MNHYGSAVPSSGFRSDTHVKIWKDVMQRYNFNLDQMEAKYKNRATSGMVYRIEKDRMEFDPEYCGAEDEETHLRTLRREVDSLKEPEGRAVISTPCLDPDEKDPKQRARLAKMNKMFITFRRDRQAVPYIPSAFREPLTFSEWRKTIRRSEPIKHLEGPPNVQQSLQEKENIPILKHSTPTATEIRAEKLIDLQIEPSEFAKKGQMSDLSASFQPAYITRKFCQNLDAIENLNRSTKSWREITPRSNYGLPDRLKPHNQTYAHSTSRSRNEKRAENLQQKSDNPSKHKLSRSKSVTRVEVSNVLHNVELSSHTDEVIPRRSPRTSKPISLSKVQYALWNCERTMESHKCKHSPESSKTWNSSMKTACHRSKSMAPPRMKAVHSKIISHNTTLTHRFSQKVEMSSDINEQHTIEDRSRQAKISPLTTERENSLIGDAIPCFDTRALDLSGTKKWFVHSDEEDE